jgi:hypothetical protein
MTEHPELARCFSTGAASWIWSDEGVHARETGAASRNYESRWFRFSFVVEEESSAKPFLAAVTADSIYLLWFNGVLVSRGPARGDIRHHFFEDLNLTSLVHAGRNEIRALVVDYSGVACFPPKLGAPASVMTYKGGFAFEGWFDGDVKPSITSGSNWQVCRARSRKFIEPEHLFGGFVGYFEEFDSGEWMNEQRDGQWSNATCLYPAERMENMRDSLAPYGLCPRIVPPLAIGEDEVFADAFREGGQECSDEEKAWLRGVSPWRIPAGGVRSLILDAGELRTGYPVIEAAGRGGKISLVYAEALRAGEGEHPERGLIPWAGLESVANENADGKEVWTFDRRGRCLGCGDVMLTSGQPVRFEPLSWRTFRFLKVTVEAGAEDIAISPPRHRRCENAAVAKAAFRSSAAWSDEIWARSVRTVRCCTHETFEDCPYYEQLQYAGDSQIISKLHLLLTGDARLSRQALLHFDWSRLPEGITASRYPCRLPQVIPSWSLHWIAMARDYLLFTADKNTIGKILPGIGQVLDWFRRRKDDHGLPTRLPYWNCVDWTPGWVRGQPPGWDTGPTCVISCQYLCALRDAAWLHRQAGCLSEAVRLDREASRMAGCIREVFCDAASGLFFDSPQREVPPSILASAWAVCAGLARPHQRKALGAHLDQCSPSNTSFFGMYWVFQARRILGCVDWESNLLPWREMLDTELTTWPEDTAFWRSLCHAWSAHPIVECIEGGFGLEILDPGWKRISLNPHPGSLKSAALSLPTPHGALELTLESAERATLLTVSHSREISVEVKGKTGVHNMREGENRTLIETWEFPRNEHRARRRRVERLAPVPVS